MCILAQFERYNMTYSTFSNALLAAANKAKNHPIARKVHNRNPWIINNNKNFTYNLTPKTHKALCLSGVL